MHTLHLLARDPAIDDEARDRYRRARDEQWAFVRGAYLDDRWGGIRELPIESDGGWRARVVRRLQPAAGPPRKLHGWKDPLHEVATFLALCGDE